MSIHINAKPGDIANIVLMPGDPLRAKYIADNYLSDVKKVNETRNAFYFTGTYKGKRVTIGSSGMGCASIGIYSFELYTEYEVDCIIRIGTCGAYTTNLKLLDLINVDIVHQGNVFSIIDETAKKLQYPLRREIVHSSDIFYRKEISMPAIAVKHICSAVEMEAFALFANAKYTNKKAATILTVSDVIPTHEQISAAAREKSLLPMIELALETTLQL